MRARPLHRYKMMGFEVLHTQQIDLHLLKFSNRLLLKPLSEYMLDFEFWQEHICERSRSTRVCLWVPVILHLAALFTLGFEACTRPFLVPSFITWHWWKEFAKDYLQRIDVNALDQVNKRYHFGDLRLGRINSIYRTRFMFTHFVRGYLYRYNRYVIFFQRNVG